MKSALAVAMPRRIAENLRVFSSDSHPGRFPQESREYEGSSQVPMLPAILPAPERPTPPARTPQYYATLLASVLFETALLLISVLDKALFLYPDEDKKREDGKFQD